MRAWSPLWAGREGDISLPWVLSGTAATPRAGRSWRRGTKASVCRALGVGRRRRHLVGTGRCDDGMPAVPMSPIGVADWFLDGSLRGNDRRDILK